MAGLSLAIVTPGLAQQPTIQQQRVACTPDALRLCSHEIPNLSRIIDCLRSNRANLSPACTKIFDTVEGRRRVSTRSLSQDGISPIWCAGKQPGEPPSDVWATWCEEDGRAKR